MISTLVFNWLALLTLAPAAQAALRREASRDAMFWLTVLLAVAGPLLWAGYQLAGAWNPSLSVTLWVGVAASMALFAVVAALDAQAWRLAILLMPYEMLLGLFAALFAHVGSPPAEPAATAWLDLHIVVSVLTLALLTLAAVAAMASFLQGRALKLKRRGSFTRRLPPVADSERLFERLLVLSEAVLAIGVITGMVTERLESGSLLKPEHKTMLTLLAFLVIGALLIGRRTFGVRGQIAARTVLLAYLLVILGYFGMKFVHQVLLA